MPGHTKRSDMDHTVFLQITPCLPSASQGFRQMAPPPTEVQGIWLELILFIYRPRRDERLSWPGWLTYSWWFAHMSGYPSAAGRARDKEVRWRKRPTFYRYSTHPTTLVATWDNGTQLT